MKFTEIAKKQILELWIARVCEVSAIAREQDTTALRDHIPAFLDKLATVIDHKPTKREQSELSDLSQTHGFSRAIMPEYSITQTLEEYSILRKCILEVLNQDSKLSTFEQEQVHSLIDEAVVHAGTEFSEVRRTFAESLMEKVVQTNEDLRQFAAIAAHDLRAPIATIAGHIQFISDEIGTKSMDVDQSFQFINSATSRMLTLIDKLLEYAGLGSHQIHVEAVDLGSAVNAATANLQGIIATTHAQVNFANLPTVRGDQTLLIQLFQNLISNSIKFRTTASPLIEIKFLDEDDLRWIFTVTDNGIGFDSQKSEFIFEPFKRLHSANEYQGSGLGLSTCKRVIKLHGGSISAASVPGKGSIFTFTLSKLL
jgi:light-regulated signal transduction histidine kinase (bacteriophytochrome)